MSHQDGVFNSKQRSCARTVLLKPGETIELKDELDRLVQDSFCKLKIRAGEAHQLPADFQPILG
jgi:hypothetical protein